MFWLGKSITPKKGQKIGVSPIEYIILAHLRYRELLNNDEPVGQYGNEFIKDLNEIFQGSWQAQSGTIYPILSKLDAKKDLLKGEKRKTKLGPIKKVYILTDKGRNLIDAIVKENLLTDENFIQKYIELLKPFKEKFEIDNLEDNTQTNQYDGLTEEKTRKICKSCGNKLKGEGYFCPMCGEEIA